MVGNGIAWIKKSKGFFIFFLFYWYIITRNKKRYELIREKRNRFIILVTPSLLLILSLVWSSVDESSVFNFLDKPFFVLTLVNLLMVAIVEREGQNLAIKERDAKEKERREQRENERRIQREQEERERMEQERIREDENRRRWERIRAEQNAWYEEQRRKQEKQHSSHQNAHPMNDAYQILGITPYSDERTVKKAFRILSKQYHPDMPNGNAKTFIRIKKAYDAIMRQAC